jgi:hypothetical protein
MFTHLHTIGNPTPAHNPQPSDKAFHANNENGYLDSPIRLTKSVVAGTKVGQRYSAAGEH